MDLNSYIQLKEAYTQVGKPQQLEAYMSEALKGADGKPLPVTAADKAAAAKSKNDAAYSAKAKKFKKSNPGVTDMTAFKAGGGNEKARQQGVDRGSGGSSAFRKMVQKSNIQRQGRDNIANKDRNVANQEKAKAAAAAKDKADSKSFQALMKSKIPGNKPNPKPDPKSDPKSDPNPNPNPKLNSQTTNTSGNQKITSKPSAPAKDRMAGASKAARMGAWAKANSDLAKKKANRDSTRGTSSTSNPMMKDLKSRMPKPVAPNKPSGGGLSSVKPQSFKSSVSAGSAMKSATSKPAASKPSSPSFGAGIKAGSMLKKEEFSNFDIILSHLIEQGFGDDEALKLMVNMPEEKREEILQISEKINLKDQSSKRKSLGRGSSINPDAKSTGYESPNEFRSAEKKYAKTQKEETDSLYQAYLSMMSEEESDKRKDKHLESGGHAARTDYSKPPATGNDFGKKKPMSDEERRASMAKIMAKIKKQGGK